MSNQRSSTLSIGQTITVDGAQLRVVATTATTVTTQNTADGSHQAWYLPHLARSITSEPDYPQGVLSVPESTIELDALAAHIVEATSGINPLRQGPPLPCYDLAATSQRERDSAKLEELSEPMSLRSWERKRRAYAKHGISALVDKRNGRPTGTTVPQSVVEATTAVLASLSHTSTRQRSWAIHLVEQQLQADERRGAGVTHPHANQGLLATTIPPRTRTRTNSAATPHH